MFICLAQVITSFVMFGCGCWSIVVVPSCTWLDASLSIQCSNCNSAQCRFVYAWNLQHNVTT